MIKVKKTAHTIYDYFNYMYRGAHIKKLIFFFSNGFTFFINNTTIYY